MRQHARIIRVSRNYVYCIVFEKKLVIIVLIAGRLLYCVTERAHAGGDVLSVVENKTKFSTGISAVYYMTIINIVVAAVVVVGRR